MIHRFADIVREGLCKRNQYARYEDELQGTFDNLPFGRFFEKFALSDDCFGPWSFENSDFHHSGTKFSVFGCWSVVADWDISFLRNI